MGASNVFAIEEDEIEGIDSEVMVLDADGRSDFSCDEKAGHGRALAAR
jgi:hypothetical protein